MFKKKVTSYLSKNVLDYRESDLLASSATVFLREVVSLCDSIHSCKRTFKRKKNGSFTKDSSDSFERIVVSSFALLMSNFEMYQKKQFSHLVDSHFSFDGLGEVALAKNLEKAGCSISLQRVLAGGGDYGEVGDIIADALPGWHNPERVNVYFRSIFPEFNLYSKKIIQELLVLWQLRHSIVHTGGVVTRADSVKVPALSKYRDTRIVFGEEFMPAVGRRFHIMIELILRGLREVIVEKISPYEGQKEQDKEEFIDSLVGYSSPRKSWFRNVE